jgi:hypothetical protein
MSGDSINSLKLPREQPLNLKELEYTERLLEPFENIVIERFNGTLSGDKRMGKNVFVLVAIALVLIINFPKIQQKAGINPYILWLISAFLLLGVVY